MGLFKGLKKALKVVFPVQHIANTLVKDTKNAVESGDWGKLAMAAGMTALGPVGVIAGAATLHQAGKEAVAGQVAQKQEKQAKIGEAIKEGEYNQQVAEANERAYQQNRASLLSARREYGKKIGTAYVRAGARTSDETESKLG